MMGVPDDVGRRGSGNEQGKLAAMVPLPLLG